MSTARPTPRQCLKVDVAVKTLKLNWAVYFQSFTKAIKFAIGKNFVLLRDPGAGRFTLTF